MPCTGCSALNGVHRNEQKKKKKEKKRKYIGKDKRQQRSMKV